MNYLTVHTWHFVEKVRRIKHGSQVSWYVPHSVSGGWVVQHYVQARAFYSHEGD